MRQPGKRTNIKNPTAWSGWPCLIVLLVSFFIGVICGSVFAALSEPSAELGNYLQDYFHVSLQGEVDLSFFSVLWDCIKWPFLAVALGFTALGVLGIPVLFAVRGFLFSFSVCTFSVLFGRSGVAVASILFSVTILFVLPVLFAVGCEGFRVSCARLPNAAVSERARFRLEIMLPSIGVLAIAIALQWTVVPTVFSAICSRVFT